MAIVINQFSGTIETDQAGDEIRMPFWIKSVRFVAGAGQLATDVIQLVDPLNPTEILWTTFGMATEATEAELIEKWWHNGWRLGTNTGDRGTVFISYK